MYTIIKRTTNLAVAVVILTTLTFSGCNQSELDELFPGDGESPEGDRIALTIGEVIIPGYNQTVTTRGASENDSESDDLFNEWVVIEECNVTRSIEAEPEMCVMRLCQDTVPGTTIPATRASLTTNAKIRLIAFDASDKSFVGAADYTVNGATITPVGSDLVLKAFNSYTIVGYTFNNTASLGTVASSYTWNSSTISIPDMNNDFLTCFTTISNLSSTNSSISLSFSHQLSKMSLVLVKGDGITGISAANNVTISNGGTSTTWKVGASAVEGSVSAASQKFSTTATGTSSAVRILPYPSNHTVSVTFPSISLNGVSKSNITISSASAVRIQPGKTYTMTITFSKKPGMNIPEGDITECSGSDKTTLASVTFASGNLIQPGNTTGAPTFAGSTSDYGHYYCWLSDWMGNGSTSRNGNDPCQSVAPAGKWYTPSYSLLQLLVRCTNKQLVSNGGKNGMWFGGSGRGLFLPAAGYRYPTDGSGTTASNGAGSYGYYWSNEENASDRGYDLYFYTGYAYTYSYGKRSGFSVRCVQGAK